MAKSLAQAYAIILVMNLEELAVSLQKIQSSPAKVITLSKEDQGKNVPKLPIFIDNKNKDKQLQNLNAFQVETKDANGDKVLITDKKSSVEISFKYKGETKKLKFELEEDLKQDNEFRKDLINVLLQNGFKDINDSKKEDILKYKSFDDLAEFATKSLLEKTHLSMHDFETYSEKADIQNEGLRVELTNDNKFIIKSDDNKYEAKIDKFNDKVENFSQKELVEIQQRLEDLLRHIKPSHLKDLWISIATVKSAKTNKDEIVLVSEYLDMEKYSNSKDTKIYENKLSSKHGVVNIETPVEQQNYLGMRGRIISSLGNGAVATYDINKIMKSLTGEEYSSKWLNQSLKLEEITERK